MPWSIAMPFFFVRLSCGTLCTVSKIGCVMGMTFIGASGSVPSISRRNAETQAAYGGVSLFPTLFFIDKAGVVVKHVVNGQEKAVLEAAIKAALN